MLDRRESSSYNMPAVVQCSYILQHTKFKAMFKGNKKGLESMAAMWLSLKKRPG